MNHPEKNRRILIIDDNPAIHADFRKILEPEADSDEASLRQVTSALFGGAMPPASGAERFELDSAYQGQEGLAHVREAVQSGRPYAMAFVDVRMPPGWDGIETISELWKVDPAMQIVICTAHSDYSLAEMIERLGETDRLLILKKPLDNMEVRLLAITLTEKWRVQQQAAGKIQGLVEAVVDAEQLANVLQESYEQLEAAHASAQDYSATLSRLVQQRTAETVATRDITVFVLAKLAEYRDPETGEHLERMRSYTQVLAMHLAQEGPYTKQIDEHFLEDLYRSSPLHDIGKVAIPDAILLKPARLAPDEFEIMKRHTVIGAEALEHAAQHSSYGGFLAMGALIARYHHERFDGSGYPEGLAAQEIPLAARIVGLADVFDALTSVRVYKEAIEPKVARVLIEEQRGAHFDPAVVDAFLARYDDFLRIHESSVRREPQPLEVALT
jgi:putative two-component system response regulator